ncbi:ROK family protein [Nocardia sp. ET3-3]|uniref:ROK family protein n=1 Tax=Nocardia terrae TaxID=2675851 RepID=A0A7K1UU50_9NOCA|nr:ROK family transcriptional regulator [Nocardia terrae]MVU77883.1 ROK family protein [Nocardia terrae]
MTREDRSAVDELPWNRQRLRSNNEWLLLEQLRTAGPSSRAQLARDTGLSKPTVSSALAALQQHGLVREVGTVAPERGRTAVVYEPDPTAGYVLGLDVGRAYLRTAVADLSGKVLSRTDVPNRARTATALAQTAAEAVRETLGDAGVPVDRVVHTVLGSPGVFDPQDGRMHYAVNLPGWGRAGLLEELHDALGVSELSVHNDANLAALGEYAHGGGRGSRLFVYVLIGTGLGVGIVSRGELFTGAHGAAGEVGFLPAAFGDPAAGASRRGALEEAVTADAVVRAARDRGMTGRLTAKRVFDAARAGDPVAADVVRQEGERIALVVAAVTAVLDPDVIVVGGGLGRSADLLLEQVRTALARTTPLRPTVRPSELGDDAVLLGAIATALRTARPQVFDRRTPTAH